ncbi:MAG: TauD/TfdA family dioxygenase [Alphaproteobacteria bacterium]|nr:TauD/TfdA family dioxygenase [Alphaproteobacteria bacterium]
MTTLRMLTEKIAGPQAWTRDVLTPADWIVTLTEAAKDELRAVLTELRNAPLNVLLLNPADYKLDACRQVMDEVRRRTQKGPMFAVLDRLPMDEMTREESVSLYWILSSLLARPVAQKLNGQMFFDVRDTGAKLKPGSGIRPTVTNVDLRFHNDNSYNETPPEYVALLCQQTAKEGGVSRLVSVYTVHNALLEQHADLLPRLYRPFWYDRHAEHHEGESKTFAAPIFEFTGETLKARLAVREIVAGYQLRNERMDNETVAAIDAVEAVFDRPELRVDLDFRPGQIQYVNNRATGHARTEFVDWPEDERKRHLVRLWLRDEGRRGYRG